MAKRRAARAKGKGRKTAGRRAGASRPRSRAAGSARKVARKRAVRRTRTALRKGAARKGAARKGAARKGVRKTSRKARVRKTPRLRSRQATARKSPAHGARSVKSGGRPAVAATSGRKVPALNRERRIVRDDDLLPMPPSSLDFDRSASSARTGHRELVERLHHHAETSPALSGGDVDADWEGAYAVGDEAPGGDNPTLDQDIVDDIGKAIGVQYEDNEELKGEKKISDRDKKRWELDPASSEDYDDR